jgi:hypothetical protein
MNQSFVALQARAAEIPMLMLSVHIIIHSHHHHSSVRQILMAGLFEPKL